MASQRKTMTSLPYKRVCVATLLLAAATAFSACSRPEPGPAERIGHAIDELSRGFKDYNQESEDEERLRRARRGEDDYDSDYSERRYRERYRERYGRDPYYDEEQNPYYSGDYRDPYRD
jgi:hypothetical protein